MSLLIELDLFLSFHYFLLVSFKLGELVKRIEQDLEESKAAAKGKELEYKDRVNGVLLLEKSIKEHDNNREGRLKNLEQKIKGTKSKLQSCLKDLKVHNFSRNYNSLPSH